MKHVLAFFSGMAAGAAGMLTHRLVVYSKESYPHLSTCAATKRMIDRAMWEAVH